VRKLIYLDNAATMQPRAEAIIKAMPILFDEYGNPSSQHSVGFRARRAVEDARQRIADALEVEPDNIFFTSGSTEAANYVMRCGYKSNIRYMSPIEHHAFLNSAKALCEVHEIPVDKYGRYLFGEVSFIDDGIICLSVGNNVIGNIVPIEDYRRLWATTGCPIAIDVTQSFGHLDITEYISRCDIAFGSFHKMGGVQGCGFIYISDDLKPQLAPMAYGGAQENGFRASTENVFGIVVGGLASEIAFRNMRDAQKKVEKLRNYFFKLLLENFSGAMSINGEIDYNHRLAGNINIRFDNIRGEELLEYLNQFGICASSGSACDSDSGEPNHVLKAIGLTDKQANASIRFSLSEDNTKEDIEECIKILRRGVDLLS